MTDIQPVTPFGAALNPHVFMAGIRHRRAQAKYTETKHAETGSEGTNQNGIVADKWALLRALTTAREDYGLSDRAIAVLDALLTCLPGREIDGSVSQVVHPSNRELKARTGGMAQATLRRHIASLVASGLIIRRDSPNGKRYAVRDEHGIKADAFGFDLSPFGLAASDIYAAADARQAEAKAQKQLREATSLATRDCARIIAAGLQHAETLKHDRESHCATWEGFAAEFASFGLRMPRGRDGVALKLRYQGLLELRKTIETAYLALLDFQDLNTNDAHYERHQQNSNADTQFERGNEKRRDENAPNIAPEVKFYKRHDGFADIPLARLITTCPDFTQYARDGIRDWAEAAQIANLVRSMLGVSPDAWRQAVSLLGRDGATIAIACILQRAHMIRSPGGYLRALTEKAGQSGFNIEPMLRAIEGKG